MIDRHRNSLLQQHATQDIRLKGLFVQKPSSANQVRQAIAQAHLLTTQVGQVRLFASALNPYLNYINTVYECLYLNTFVHIFSNYCQPVKPYPAAAWPRLSAVAIRWSLKPAADALGACPCSVSTCRLRWRNCGSFTDTATSSPDRMAWAALTRAESVSTSPCMVNASKVG